MTIRARLTGNWATMTWVVVLPTFSAILVVTVLVLSYYTPLRRTPRYVLLTGNPCLCPH